MDIPYRNSSVYNVEFVLISRLHLALNSSLDNFPQVLLVLDISTAVGTRAKFLQANGVLLPIKGRFQVLFLKVSRGKHAVPIVTAKRKLASYRSHGSDDQKRGGESSNRRTQEPFSNSQCLLSTAVQLPD